MGPQWNVRKYGQLKKTASDLDIALSLQKKAMFSLCERKVSTLRQRCNFDPGSYESVCDFSTNLTFSI